MPLRFFLIFLPLNLCILLLLPLVACNSFASDFQQYGEMRPVMREGHTEARVSLCSANIAPHAFAIGALAGLEGEVTIANGQVWVTRVVNGKPATTGPSCIEGDNATLLSVGHISRSVQFPLVATADAHALENAIHIATENCNWLDANGPFVFEIKGTAITVKTHIITGECAYAVADADPLSLEIVSPTQVSVVGIYAQGQAGVLTHHGTSVHMHVIFQRDGATITGHIDEISFLAGAELHLPTE